jgi:membrane-associated phospholipid phosphatase
MRREDQRVHQAPGPLDPPWADGRQVALARRWQRLRDGVPSVLYLLAWAVVTVAVGAAVGMLLARLPGGEALSRADSGVDRWFAAHRTKGWNTASHLATDAAETLTITILAVLTFAATAFAWRRWREPLLVAAAVIGEVTIFVLITVLAHRPRPPVSHLDVAPPTSSFPSGHTAAAIALYGSWAVLAWERARSALLRGLLTALAAAIPVIVALARLYRGMHFPTDVIAGAALGASWLAVSVRAIRLGAVHHGLRAARSGALRRRLKARHG